MKIPEKPKAKQPKLPPKAEKPGKPLTVTHRDSKYDNIDSADPAISDEEARDGYTVIEQPRLGRRRS